MNLEPGITRFILFLLDHLSNKLADKTFVAGPYEFGKWTCQGARSDWIGLKEDIKSGLSELDVFEKHTRLAFTCPRGIEKYRQLVTAPKERDFKTKVIFIYGPPGTGKTRKARAIASGPHPHWRDGTNGTWWDNYDGVSSIILDDFYGWYPYGTILRLWDRYPLEGQIKNLRGGIILAPKDCIVTSNSLPHQWWGDNVPYQHDAIYRRIDQIIWIKWKEGTRTDETEEINYEEPEDKVRGRFADFIMAIGGLSDKPPRPSSKK